MTPTDVMLTGQKSSPLGLVFVMFARDGAIAARIKLDPIPFKMALFRFPDVGHNVGFSLTTCRLKPVK